MVWLKAALALAATLVAWLAYTAIFLYVRMDGVKAATMPVFRAWTVYSPLYWILAVAVVAGMFWLLRGWVFRVHA
jgi:hypothetical protein